MANESSPEGKVRALELAAAVLAASQTGNIPWNESDDDDSFYTILAGRALTVRSDDGDGNHPFTLWVAESGEILESVNTVLDEADRRLDQAVPEWQKLISELYAEARRRGKRFNQVIDEMLKDVPQPPDDIPF